METPDVAGVSVAPGCCSSPGDRGAACALPLGSLGLSAPKETEEEREDADSEQEDEAPPCCCLSPLLRSWFHAFFPNTPPFVWFFLQLFICFLLLLMGLERVATAKSEFFLARAPPSWVPTSREAKPPLEVVRIVLVFLGGLVLLLLLLLLLLFSPGVLLLPLLLMFLLLLLMLLPCCYQYRCSCCCQCRCTCCSCS